MSFKDQYTTKEILDVELILNKDTKEKNKIILSNDAYAIGQLLETLTNKMVR